jgi:hypothetical protein
MRIGNFSLDTLDGSSHHTGDAAFAPATPKDLQHSRANLYSHNSHNIQHKRVKVQYIFLYAKGQPAQPEMFWRAHHTKLDPKSMRAKPLCLWGV